MSPKTFIFIGRSGCGKGTQASLLDGFLHEKSPKASVLHLETGLLFREFIQGATDTQKLSNETLRGGGLQPEFLTVHLWSNFFVKNYKEGQHMIIDGTPRRLHEAHVLGTAFDFYKREKPYIVYLNVSREWARAKLSARHRMDDTSKDIESRLNWFDTEVAPVIDFYRKSADYAFLDINGERPVEEIHEDIIRKTGLLS